MGNLESIELSKPNMTDGAQILHILFETNEVLLRFMGE